MQRMSLQYAFVVLACCLAGNLVSSQYYWGYWENPAFTMQYLKCVDGKTHVKTPYIFTTGKYADCPQLIGAYVDIYQLEYRSECQRWKGGDLPNAVASAYVTECHQDSNGTLRYRSEVCCHGVQTEMRCFTCSEESSHYACDYHGTVETCAAGQVCVTKVNSENGWWWQNCTTFSKGCMDKTACEAKEAASTDICQGNKDYTLADKGCYRCIGTNFGNWNGYDEENDPSHESFCDYSTTTDIPTTTEYYTDYTTTDSTLETSNCTNVWCGYGTCHDDDSQPDGYSCSCHPYSWEVDGHCPYSYCNNGTLNGPCLNGGACSESDIDPYYTCCCRQGYYGFDCGDIVPTCVKNPTYCQNGGTCLDKGEEGISCKCVLGWVGDNCELSSNVTCANPTGHYVSGEYKILYDPTLSQTCSAYIPYNIKNLWDSCQWKLKRLGGPRFVNKVHGNVEDLERSGLKSCETGTGSCMWLRGEACCPTCMSAPCLNGGWCVQKADHDFVCHCRHGFEGTLCETPIPPPSLVRCYMWGDPHYKTFDGLWVHFQGRCKYTMVAPSVTDTGLPDFQVLVKHRNLNGITRVAYLKYLEVIVFGKTYRLGLGKKLYVDGVEVTPEAYYPGVSITFNGNLLQLKTNFNLIVQSDGNMNGYVKLPDTYAGKLGGICANFDGNKTNDMTTSDGRDVMNYPNAYSVYGDSWYVPDDTDPDCPKIELPDPPMDPEIVKLAKTAKYCGPITNQTGPFKDCVLYQVEVADTYLEGCIFDFAIEMTKETSCLAIEAFAEHCRTEGFPPDDTWRADVDCPMECPTGREYNAVGSACHVTCESPLAEIKCTVPKTEVCKCPDGKVLHNGVCQERGVCGCVDSDGVRHKVGETWKSTDCTKDYTCSVLTTGGWGEITERVAPCPRGSECQTVSGKTTCVSTHRNGRWGPWQEWATCTSPCGEGDQTRKRECNDPPPSSRGAPCPGPATQTRPCRSDCPAFKPQDCEQCDLIVNPGGYLPDPCNCYKYYQCYRYQGQWRAHQRSCAPCTRWDQDRLTCVHDTSITDRSGCAEVELLEPEEVVSAGGVCHIAGQTYKTVPDDITKYIWSVHGTDLAMRCPPGTGFDVKQCRCVFGSVVSTATRRVFLLSFDQSFETVGGVWVQPFNVELVSGCTKGNCASFDGVKSRIEIPYFTNNGFSQFTFSLWFKRTGTNDGQQGLVYNGDCKDEGSLQVISENQDTVRVGIHADLDLRNADIGYDKARPDKWHHIAFVYDGKHVQLFIDGKRVDKSGQTGETKRNTCPLLLGYMFGASSGGYFSGLMDEVSFYKVALSKKEIKDLYAGKEVL